MGRGVHEYLSRPSQNLEQVRIFDFMWTHQDLLRYIYICYIGYICFSFIYEKYKFLYHFGVNVDAPLCVQTAKSPTV